MIRAQAPEAAPRGASTPTAAAKDGQPSPATGDRDDTGGGKDEAAGRPGKAGRQPGTLSRGEADQLLDSLDGQMQRLPMAAFGKRPSADDDRPTKDW